jgi:hypothetical protein
LKGEPHALSKLCFPNSFDPCGGSRPWYSSPVSTSPWGTSARNSCTWPSTAAASSPTPASSPSAPWRSPCAWSPGRLPPAWPQVLGFFGALLVIERSPDQSSGDAGLLPVGLPDRRIGLARAFDKKFRYAYNEGKGGHTWDSWRNHLFVFAPLLFRDEE